MEALAFAGEDKVRCHFSSEKLEQINAVFDQMRAGAIEGRVVLKV
jgi:propanol-preferring alcohol dehydrogenase